MPDLVEVVFVELAHETGKVAVLEMLRQDGLGEFLALESQFPRVSLTGEPTADRHEEGGLTSKTTKLSPSSPQRTMDA